MRTVRVIAAAALLTAALAGPAAAVPLVIKPKPSSSICTIIGCTVTPMPISPKIQCPPLCQSKPPLPPTLPGPNPKFDRPVLLVK